MAHIKEQLVIIKLSKLLKNDAETPYLMDPDQLSDLEDIVQGIVGPSILAELVDINENAE